MRLGVNIDHVATLRNARKGSHPELLRAAQVVKNCGCYGVTMHLREDRRHILDDDLWVIKNNLDLNINLEMAATEEMLAIALDLKPNAVCLVPEKREELTTEGGLNLVANQHKVIDMIAKLQEQAIKVTLFLDPQMAQIMKAIEVGVNAVELHTGSYANAKDVLSQEHILSDLQQAASYLQQSQVEVHAGHGLDYNNIGFIKSIKEVEEVNIGHFLIGEAVFVGLENAIKKMQNLLV